MKRMLQGELFQGGSLSLFVQLQFVVAKLLTGIILARILGPAGFGIYSFALAIILLLQIIPNSGLENVVLRYSAQLLAKRHWGLLRGLWRWGLTASVIYGIVTAALLATLGLSGWLPARAALKPTALVAAAFPMLFMPFATFLGSAIRSAAYRRVIGQLPQFLIRPWIYLALVAIVSLIDRRAMSAEIALYAQGAATLVTAMVGIYWLIKLRPQELLNARPEFEIKRWLHTLLPLSVTGGLMLINTQADILMLGILGTAHATGLYRVAAEGANLVALSLTAANIYIAPRIAAMHSQHEHAKIQRLLTITSRSTFVIATLCALIFFFEGQALLKSVFGLVYVDALWPLFILCAGQLINVGAGSVGLTLNMTGNERDTAKMAAIAAVCNIGLNALLIPVFGAVGAAFATSITMLVWNGLMLFKVWQRTNINASVLGEALVPLFLFFSRKFQT